MAPSIEDNEAAIRQARHDLERALAEVKSGLDKVEDAVDLFRRLEIDLASGRRSINDLDEGTA